jgi:hypothetical protein
VNISGDFGLFGRHQSKDQGDREGQEGTRDDGLDEAKTTADRLV